MNNSLERLIDGMAATLRSEIIPQIGTEFARGQAFGLIYMLNSIRLRAAWSAKFLGEQIAAQNELRDTLQQLVQGLDAPTLPDAGTAGIDPQALESLRDTNDGRVCELIAWLADNADRVGAEKAKHIDAALHHYMNRQLKFELVTSAKPMFAEISSGAE